MRLPIITKNGARSRIAAYIDLVWSTIDPDLRGGLASVGALVTLSAILRASAPIALKDATNGIADHSLAGAITGAAFYVVLLLGARGSQSLQTLQYGVIWRKVHKELSKRAYRHVLCLPNRFFSDRHTGQITATLSEGLIGTRSVLNALFFSVFPAVIQFITVVVIFIHLDQFIPLCVLSLFLIVYGVVVYHSQMIQRSLHERAVKSAANSAGVAVDALANHELAKVFSAGDFMSGRIGKSLEQAETDWEGFFRAQFKGQLASCCLFAIALAVMLIFTVFRIYDRSGTIGDFVMLNAYMLQVMAPVEGLGASSWEISKGLNFVQALIGLLTHETEQATGPVRTLSNSGPIELCVESLCFGYTSGQKILNDVSFRVPPGSTVALVGLSGSGKSSLIRLLLGLYRVDKGTIKVDGISLDEIPLVNLRSAIGLVPQDLQLLHGTILENLQLANPCATLQEVESALDVVQLSNLLLSLPEGPDTIIGERGTRLSGGERQRLALARTILRRPQLIILDESTSALDPQTEFAVRAGLDSALANTTKLIVTHRLARIVAADEILVLNDGRITERGTHQHLMELGGHYRSMWSAQQDTCV